MTLPIVSVLTPTFGRAPGYLHLLEECVQSFLDQNYPANKREMLILNDTPGQILSCAATGVRVVNWHERISSLGKKRDMLCDLAVGDVLCVLDDDDLIRANHIKTCVERLYMYDPHGYWKPIRGYFNPQRSYWLNGKELSVAHGHGVCHNASAFTRMAWRAAGGYPDESVTEDASMDRRLKALKATAQPLGDDPKEWTHVYRWGVSDCHISGGGNPAADWERRGAQVFPDGVYQIVPGYRAETLRLMGHLLGRA